MNITYAIYKDVNNYNDIKHKIKTDDFIDSEMKELFDIAVLLYSKFSFSTLNKNRILAILSTEEYEERVEELLKTHIDLIQYDYDFDIKGEYELYTKNLGLYKFDKFVEDKGGLDSLLNILNDPEHNTENIRDFLEYHIEDMFKTTSSRVDESFLEDGLDEMVQDIMENRVETGITMKYNKYTNFFLNGIHKGVNLEYDILLITYFTC